MPEQARHLRAIVFSDVVDSSVKIFADELIAIQRIKEDLALIRDAVQSHGGLLVKSLGDGLLVTFDGPTQALQFIQSAVQALRARGRQSLAHRFGLHTGEIYADGDDILGQGVHLASRLQTVSPANGVAFTRSTYELIDPRFRQLAWGMADVELKGLPERMDLYCLGPEELLRFGRAPFDTGLNVDALLQDTPYSVVRPLSRSKERNTLLLQERQRDRQAVLKLIPADAALEEALRVESACLDRLRHPRIPRVLDVYAQGGIFCFIQEHIAGPSLHGSLDLLRRKQRLAELLRQVLQVLEVVHAAGLVHGDIHPANLILPDSDSAPFLVDFSLLRARTEAKRQQPDGGEPSLSELGRPYFTAPERARFGRITPAADLYALGVSALLLYCGGEPSTLYDETLACWKLEGLDLEVQRWLAPLLEDQPARRLKHAADALQLLDQPSSVVVSHAAPQSPLPTRSAVDGPRQPVSKVALHDHLVVIYGPMVALLLESTPSTVEPHQLPLLQERLVGAGLALADVEEAMRKAQLKAPDAPVGGDIETMAPPEPPAVVPQPQAAPADPGLHAALLALLRDRVGPIADFIWTAELCEAAQHDPAFLRSQLQNTSVPVAVIDELLEQAATVATHLSASDREASSAPAANAPPAVVLRAEEESAAPAVIEDDQLRAHLTELIGPIGLTVFEQVRDLSKTDQPRAVLAALRRYGVDEALLDELALRFGCT
ncbi:protein kinase [Synechococcus sp. UW140]|uniref:protein kinase domain-containing protein n=1 Tax=Synechococcus sp. UW140 TaxID=368503 RepID=UPI000E0F7E92|nr:protein kinase [Synechococcus sp. UW140]